MNQQNVFSKNILIKTADIVVFPNAIEFLNIAKIDKAKTSKVLESSNLKKKENIQSFLPKAKLQKTHELKTDKIKSEIEKLENSIKKKEEKLVFLEKDQEKKINEKDLKKMQELQTLIKKWKTVGQEAIIELQKLMDSRTYEKIPLKNLMKMMNMDPELFSYNEENDEFECF